MRDYKIYANVAGMESFHEGMMYQMELRNMLDHLDFLLENKKIAQEESDRLDQMLNSRDLTDHFIAKTILNTHYGYTIFTTGT